MTAPLKHTIHRALPTLLVVALTAVFLSACGSAKSQSTDKSSGANATRTAAQDPASIPPAPAVTRADADHDGDIEAPVAGDEDNSSVLDYGHEASTGVKRAVTALVTRYFAAALAGNGAAACSMLYSTLAEAVPEDYGLSPPGEPYERGSTCPVVLNGLFRHFHPQIALEQPRLTVARVRLVERHGVAVLTFRGLPDRQIAVSREGHVWRIESLLDTEMI